MNFVQAGDLMSISGCNRPVLLQRPVRLADQVWPEGTPPLVSVFCITYQHEKFIRQAIEGFLMQETTFPVEIFIHDDASTDGTAVIVKEFAERYPKLIRAVLQNENQWCSAGLTHILNLLSLQRGIFIALCEGDDYWISPTKLQKQYDFLESHSTASLCHHRVIHYNQDTESNECDFPPPERRCKVSELAHLADENFIQTCAVMLRSSAIPSIIDFGYLKLGDWPLFARIGETGWFGYIDETMAVYRLHQSSWWSPQSSYWKSLAILQMLDYLCGRLQQTNKLPFESKRLDLLWDLFWCSQISQPYLATLNFGSRVLYQTFKIAKPKLFSSFIIILKRMSKLTFRLIIKN